MQDLIKDALRDTEDDGRHIYGTETSERIKVIQKETEAEYRVLDDAAVKMQAAINRINAMHEQRISQMHPDDHPAELDRVREEIERATRGEYPDDFSE